MRWPALVPQWVELLQGDSALTAIIGANRVYPAQTNRPVLIPSIEWLMTGDPEGETFEEIHLQLDYWVKPSSGLSATKRAGMVEQRIRNLLHRDVAQELNGERLWLRYVDGRTLDYPAEPGVIHRALDFEIAAVRDKYVLT